MMNTRIVINLIKWSSGLSPYKSCCVSLIKMHQETSSAAFFRFLHFVFVSEERTKMPLAQQPNSIIPILNEIYSASFWSRLCYMAYKLIAKRGEDATIIEPS
uniref:Ovule protein n=1 Tax=Caenorhabditis tropicalis TaxID=1561998 RepID=A0A1I7UB60_9PELO